MLAVLTSQNDDSIQRRLVSHGDLDLNEAWTGLLARMLLISRPFGERTSKAVEAVDQFSD